MSRDASITLDWGDDTYMFRLRHAELIQLQEATDAGPMWVLNRLMNPNAENRGWRVQDIAQIMRLGLIGGGMEPVKALKLVRRYVEERPPVASLIYAQAVLSAALLGSREDEKKSEQDRESVSTVSPEESGDGPKSSAPGLRSA